MGHVIRAVTFDLWNTLIEVVSYMGTRVGALHEVAIKAGFRGPVEATSKAYRDATAMYEREWRTRHTQLGSESRLDYILRVLDVELDRDERAALMRSFEEVFLSNPPPLKPGAFDAVSTLSRDYRLGVISDTGVTPGRVMRRYFQDKGLLSHFKSKVFSDETGLCKPHQGVFILALEELGAEPSEAVHVGDLLRTDVAGAKAAGMKAVWVRSSQQDGETDAEPDYVIDSLYELPSLIKSLDH